MFLDGLVKSPSAALRFNFVVAAHLYVRLTPQFLRALHLELFTKPSKLLEEERHHPEFLILPFRGGCDAHG
jgi:hypothetical protein